VGDTRQREQARRSQHGLVDRRVRILLEEAQQPARRDPLVSAWILAGNEHGELQRIPETELREVFRSGQRHEDVPARQRPLETRIRMTRRARSSSSLGAGMVYQTLVGPETGLASESSVEETSAMESPETRYTSSGDVHIAYQVLGVGPLDLVYIPGLTQNVEVVWENPPQARFLGRLASLSRLILFDKRGTGMSDRVIGVPTLETRMDDIRAVMDAAGSEHAVLIGVYDGGALGALFAATYPERTSGLVYWHALPRFTRSPDLPWLETRVQYERRGEEIVRHWGDSEWFADKWFGPLLPSAKREELMGWARYFRLGGSPGSVAAFWRANADLDVCDVLPLIRVPTLVMTRTQVKRADVRNARYLADRIPGARLVELPGSDHPPSMGDSDSVLAELGAFLADVAEGKEWEAEPDRVLATVLFTDLVDSTARAAELGDRAWRNLLVEHHAIVRSELTRFRGTEMDTAGDGFFATFDGPARAIQSACAIRESLRELGLEVRTGLHTGECELIDSKVGGIAVHIGARVAALAGPGEVLVSSTVKDLVAGSGIEFEDRGEHQLKGISERWHLFEVTS
jgi:class 3 adenylate cyclase/pimeloyl-ACP methyl ester carboxylesterase